MRWLGSLVSIAAVAAWPAAAAVSAAPAPAGAALSEEYTVKVDGKPVAVYLAPVWYPTYVKPFGGPYSFASFDFAGRVRVEVTTKRPLGKVVVQPESRGVQAQVAGDTLRFTLDKPGQFSIEPEGKKGPLLLFANPLEKSRPDRGDPKVRYFGPGLHKPGRIDLTDGETLYLAAGAVVKGGVNATGKGIRILGRGILDGGDWERFKGPCPNSILLDHCTDAVVEGITIKDGWSWVLVLRGCRNVTFTNVKVCSTRCENNDGIDIVNSSKVTMRDSFIRSDDDCIAPKGMDVDDQAPVEDLLFERCCLWTDRAHVWRLGCESRAKVMRNFTFRDIDVLHYTDPTCPVISVQPAEDMLMENVTFEDVRIHREGQAKLIEVDPSPTPWAKKQTPGMVRNVVFRNVMVTGDGPGKLGSVIIKGQDAAHPIDKVVFEKVVRHGEALKVGAPEVSVTGTVTGVEYR